MPLFLRSHIAAWAATGAGFAAVHAAITILGTLWWIGTAFGTMGRALRAFTAMHHGLAGTLMVTGWSAFMTEVLAARALLMIKTALRSKRRLVTME
jgi:hypothetical protein